MADLKIYLNNDGPEINLMGEDLEQERGLCTSVLISLLSDLSVTGSPGYWGDTIGGKTKEQYTGSRLWAVKKNDNAHQVRAIQYIKSALQWMLDDNIAAGIDVTAKRVSAQRTNFIVAIKKPSGDVLNFLYRKNWDNEQIFVERIMD